MPSTVRVPGRGCARRIDRVNRQVQRRYADASRISTACSSGSFKPHQVDVVESATRELLSQMRPPVSTEARAMAIEEYNPKSLFITRCQGRRHLQNRPPGWPQCSLGRWHQHLSYRHGSDSTRGTWYPTIDTPTREPSTHQRGRHRQPDDCRTLRLHSNTSAGLLHNDNESRFLVIM